MLKWVVAAATLIYLVLCGLLAVFQRSLLYFPQPRTNKVRRHGDACQSPAPAWSSRRGHPPAAARSCTSGATRRTCRGASTRLPKPFRTGRSICRTTAATGAARGRRRKRRCLADALALFDYVQSNASRHRRRRPQSGFWRGDLLAAQRPVSRLVLVTPVRQHRGGGRSALLVRSGALASEGQVRVRSGTRRCQRAHAHRRRRPGRADSATPRIGAAATLSRRASRRWR